MIVRCVSLAMLIAAWAPLASAQELRLYTSTYDCATQSQIATSRTIFHAGKVYDVLSASGEVTIYETVPRKFTLLQINSATAAEVTQDQLRRFLQIAEEKVQEQAAELARQPGTPPGALQLLELQLHPSFEKKSDPPNRFSLISPRCLYEVETIAPPEPAVAEAYLKYADAIAELNAVLNPHSMLPGPRLQVNKELRERGVLPVLVRRQVETDRTVDLKVKHEWRWRLEDIDRQLINHWENLLAKKELRRVPFEQLQREVLSGKLTQR